MLVLETKKYFQETLNDTVVYPFLSYRRDVLMWSKRIYHLVQIDIILVEIHLKSCTVQQEMPTAFSFVLRVLKNVCQQIKISYN